MNKFFFRFVAPAAVVGLAVVCAGAMAALRPGADRVDVAAVATPVEVVAVTERTLPAVVRANGTVVASQRVTLVPEVGGRIVWTAPETAPGGRFAKGETIARIDDRDYQLLVEVERGRVQQAELELELERGRQKVAAREWELLGDGRPAQDAPLALRGPQLAVVERAVEGARSGLARAELALERTRLKAPFDAVVIDENLDVGQVVGPGTPVATLLGTEEHWVQVAVGVDELGWLDLEGEARARVVHRLGDGATVEREGRIKQLGGQLDPQTRTAQVIVEVVHPGEEVGLPLLPGAFVEVELLGRAVPGVFEVPRAAVIDGDSVLVVGPDDTLSRRAVRLAWGDERVAAVRGELADGDRVITTTLATPVEGMAVRVLASTESARADLGEGPP